MPKIAIIGCGLIGETHTRALASLGAPPVLFCDAEEARAKSLAQEFGGETSTDPFAAVSDPSIDAVYICTYHDTHAPLTIEAAKSGKAIFLEKPIAISEADCQAIVDAVQTNHVICMTGFKLHYCSVVAQARALIGKPLALTAHVLDRRWPDDSWANDPVKGGGNVLSQGCHAVEMLLDLAQAKPIRIYAEGGNLHHPGLDIIDTMAATISFDSGAVASLMIGDLGESRPVGKFAFQAMNGKQAISIDRRLTHVTYFDGLSEQVITAEEDGFLNENKEFLAALAQGRRAETNEIDGARATRVLLAGVESIQSQKPQSLERIP